MLCFPPKKDYSRFCCCLPLAAGTLMLGLFFCGYGAATIIQTIRADDWFGWGSVLPFLLGILCAIGGIGALLASCFCFAPGVTLLCKAYSMLCLSLIVSFIAQWVVWIVHWVDKSEEWAFFPDQDTQRYMIGYSVVCVIFFIVMWWAESVVHSHQQVLRAGGNGWEYKDYMEIRESRALA